MLRPARIMSVGGRWPGGEVSGISANTTDHEGWSSGVSASRGVGSRRLRHAAIVQEHHHPSRPTRRDHEEIGAPCRTEEAGAPQPALAAGTRLGRTTRQRRREPIELGAQVVVSWPRGSATRRCHHPIRTRQHWDEAQQHRDQQVGRGG